MEVSKPRVALMAIVAAADDKEAVNLSRMLGSVNGYVDAIYLQLNAPKGKAISPVIRQIAEQFTQPQYIQTAEWTNNFVDARNKLMQMVPKRYDWLVWLDSDDRVENPENIVPSLTVMPDNVHGVFILYDYQKDEFGNVVVSHWNTRAVRNNGTYHWKSSFDDDEVAVHETLVAKRSVKQVANNDWKVIHEAKPEHYREALIRNIELLEGMALRQAKTSKGVDPRVLFYLGSHSYDAHDYNKARDMFIAYLQESGWAEERAEAHIYMGKLFMMHADYQKAKTAFLQALGEYPDNPGAYLGLGKLEAKNERWEQAAAWFKRGVEVKRKLTSMVRYNYDWELYASYAEALANLGGKNLQEALKISDKALKIRPFDPVSKSNRDKILELLSYRDDMKATARLLRLLKESNEENKIIPFLDSLPKNFEDTPVVIEARQEYTPPKVWPKKSIAIYVGQGPLGIWGPWSLNEGGIGGSEEAVVRLSNELSKLEWRVIVYGMPGKRAGIYDGVEWKHYWQFNSKDEFDVLISWRQPAFFDFNFKARKKYLWLHDVMDKEELTEERIKNVTKVIYVSKYHSERPENDHIGADKKLPSGNGITPTDFIKYDGKLRRDNHRLIYMSANERGLRVLLDIWPDVKKAVPDATLTPYYGWQSFDAVNRDNPERMAWKATMMARMKELGIPQSERIGQDEINQEIFKSGIWAYPCIFPEVNCITGQKAMAGGAIPVTSDFAALKDLVKYGETVDMANFDEAHINLYRDRLIWWLQHPEEQEKIRAKMMSWARKEFSWSNTANQWDKEMA